MKIDFLKTVNWKNKRRGVVVLSFLGCLILVAFTTAAAQLKTQRHVTALQLGDAAEGARVTIVSDAALNDYEAFRRGNRFYIRIPLADFASIPPSFRADGFEDIQVQKVGDGLLVSFGLQAGASARVDQRWNRLDVIFSAPNRTLRNNLANGSTRMTSSTRNADAAGPMPPGTATTFSPSGATYGSGESYGVREGRNSGAPFSPLATNRGANNSTSNQSSRFGSSAIKSASPFPSPFASPSSVLSPTTSSTLPPATSATPATSGSYQPIFSATPAAPIVSSGSSSWKSRSDSAMRWMAANRLATLLAALILLALVVYLLLVLSRRRKNQAKAKRLKAPKVQPKVLPTSPAEEPSFSSSATSQPREFSGTRPVAEPRPSTSAAASVPDRGWVRKPSINSPSASPGEASSEEQEREVFEL